MKARMVRAIGIVCATLTLASTSHPAEAGDGMDARALYSQALAAMSTLREPAYVTFRMMGTSEGLEGDLVAGSTCLPRVVSGKTPSDWILRHRTSDHETEILDTADGERFVTDYADFDPTWDGSFRTLRHPLILSRAECDRPPVRRSPAPEPPTSTEPIAADEHLKTIAFVSVLGTGIYNVEDRGGTTCPSGDAGRALHLWSRTNDPNQQLSDVIVDLGSMQFCMVRFGRRASLLDGNFTWESHYANVAGYWMETGGCVEVEARAFGIPMGHGIWRFRLVDMQFPTSLPSKTFEPVTSPLP